MSTKTDDAGVEGEAPAREEPVVTSGQVEGADDDGQDADDESSPDEEEAAGDGAGDGDEGEEPGDAAGEGEEAGDPADEPAKPAKEPWYTKRIGKLTKEASTTKEQLRAAQEKIAALEAAQSGQEGVKLYTEEEVAARIETVASEKAAANETASKMDAVWESGTKAYKDFDKRVDGYVKAFGAEALSARPDFFQAVTDLPNGADVLYTLSGDLDRMASVLEMPPYKMGIELAKISGNLAKPKVTPISKTPAPIKPLETASKSGARDIYDPKISDQEYFRQREAAWADGGGKRR